MAAIQIAPGGNAVSTAHAVEKRLGELKGAFPQGMVYSIPYNTAPFVEISIEKVLHTLVEAMDMREAQRAYEANLNVIETARAMEQRTLDLLKR